MTKTRGKVPEALARVNQYAKIAAGGLGLTGGAAPAGPLHAQIGVSDPCNHRCVMCWDHPPESNESEATAERFGGEKQGLMPFSAFKGVVDDLFELGTRRIDIVGRGEPLLNPAIEDMIAYGKSRSMMVTLCSNASKLGTRQSDNLVRSGLDRLNVSLNAGTEKTYPRIHVTETPENYRVVKQNLRYLADCKAASDSSAPHVKLSFVVGARNFFELEQMVSVVHEVGAQEGMFNHTVVHSGTKELMLDREQYDQLLETVPRAKALAKKLGVQTNLGTFAATVPTYLEDNVTGPPVVPCYVGWYFTVILGNGSVMPCCQCSEPVGRVNETQGFAEIWSSSKYKEFRNAARQLPAPNERLMNCECDRCMLRPRNISVHNMLHPLKRIDGGEREQLITIGDLLRMKKTDRS